MPVNGVAVTAIGVGTLFTWSGIKGWSILSTAQDLITGVQPMGTELYPLTEQDAGNGTAISGDTGNAISDIAMQYKGHCYKYGGSPGLDGTSCWDCSSFANWVVGKKAGRRIPGFGPGKYNGSVHGPPTGSWGIWPGLRRISRSDVQAGDIIVWTLHMGIAINNKQMISAMDQKDRTNVGDIDTGGDGPLMKYGRLVA